jgi:hypothetical protein
MHDQGADLSRHKAPKDKGGAEEPLFYRIVKEDPGKKPFHNVLPLYSSVLNHGIIP